MNKENKTVKIAQVIKEALDKHPELGILTPMMYDPETLDPVFGILVETDKGTRLGFNVSIKDLSKNNEV